MTDMDAQREKLNSMIAENRASLEKYTPEDHPLEYARACMNIGSAFGSLAGLEDMAVNTKKAIVAFQQALRTYTLEDHPEEYAKTHSNMGNAFAMLASVEGRDENCIKAFQSFLEAFKVFNQEDYPEIFNSLIENVRMHLPVCEKLKRKLDELFINNAPPSPDRNN